MDHDCTKSVHNLFRNAAGLASSARVLIVHEPENGGYYGPGLTSSVARAAAELGYEAELLERPFVPDLTAPDPETAAAMGTVDLTLFLARMGDQIRFRPGERPARIAICYALDTALFASLFGSVDHQAMEALRAWIDAALSRAEEIRITCPAGTDLRGKDTPGDGVTDTYAIRFPLSVHTPVSCSGFSGTIAQTGFLVGTGSRFYSPYAVEIEGTLFISVEDGRITGFDGPSANVARAHYLDLADRFGIDPWCIHSWHGGIHPACDFPHPASESFERWSGGAFGNPRLLHFHSCGAYAPGEICLNLLDPTIEVDGVAIKQDGRLVVPSLSGGAETPKFPDDLNRALVHPSRNCGEALTGGLRFR